MFSPTDADLSSQTDPYDDLPDPIKQYYSRREYLFLTDSQKATLQQDETEPEWT